MERSGIPMSEVVTMQTSRVFKTLLRGILLGALVLSLSACYTCAPRGEPGAPTYRTFCTN